VSEDTHEERRSHGWRRFLLALGALIGASVIWGWLQPEPEEDEVELLPAELEPTLEPTVAPAPVVAVTPPPAPERAPSEVRRTILWTIGVVVAVGVGIATVVALRQVVIYLVLALFFSFALEPAVNYMHSKWYWRRGLATATLLAAVVVALLVMVLVFVPTIFAGVSAIAERIPQAAQDLDEWSQETLNVDLSTESLESGSQEAAAAAEDASDAPMSALFGFTVSLVGGLFALFTVMMFIFYMVAEASRFRRAMLSFFPRQRQEELLSIWEAAIEKTGGYFYSRLLIATINGGLFYVMLRIVGVPGAASLAFFEGAVAAFIPIVGTYIAAAVPIVVAWFTVGIQGALVLLIYVLIYQQVENYLIAPKIQGRTMQLHPAVAFGAALVGGALGGLMWAFLALPFAATVQASAALYIQHHEVVESALTAVEVAAPAPEPVDGDGEDVGNRAGRLLRSTKGWLRKVF
jgi:predicted PurR-regulated permease PerM